jgi:high-affinity nickel permease
MNFIYFKTVTGITLVIALIISFINLLSIENANLQLIEYVKSKKLIR